MDTYTLFFFVFFIPVLYRLVNFFVPLGTQIRDVWRYFKQEITLIVFDQKKSFPS